MQNRSSNLPTNAFIFWFCVSVSLSIVLFLWVIRNQGFDLTDEGFYLLAITTPQDVIAWPSSFYIYLQPIFTLLNHDIGNFRFVGILAIVISTVFFAHGLIRFYEKHTLGFKHSQHITSLYPFLAIGGLVYYQYALPTPSYNLINATFTYSALGFYFLALNKKQHTQSSILLFVSSLLIGANFQNKFSSSIAVLILLTISYFMWLKFTHLIALIEFVPMILGFISGLLLFFLFFQPPDEWWNTFARGYFFQTTFYVAEHSPANRINALIFEVYLSLKESLKSSALIHLLIFTAGISYLLLSRRNQHLFQAFNRFNLKQILAISIFSCLTFLAIIRQAYLGGYSPFHGWLFLGKSHEFFVLVLLVLLHVTAWVLISKRITFQSINLKELQTSFFAFGVLFFTPFVAMLGSGNAIASGLKFVFAPWYGAVFLLSLHLSRLLEMRWIHTLLITLLSLLTLIQTIAGFTLFPYGMDVGISDQNIPISLNTTIDSSNLLIDKQTSVVIESIREAAYDNGFNIGDDILAFHNLPGIVYALGGRSPGYQWYQSHTPTSKVAIEAILNLTPRERIQHAIILRTTNSIDYFPNLKEFGISFPQDYKLVGEWRLDRKWIASPSIQMWVPIKN